MADENKATEINAEIIATQEAKKVVLDEDLESKVAALEAEKAGWIEKASNYQVAYMKSERKRKEGTVDEDEDARFRRIAEETLANSELARINREQESLIKKALKENKELKLAQVNKADVPVSTTSHSEGAKVTDTLVTPDQLAAFKAMNWNDKDIERYKKNLLRYGK